MKRHDCKLKDGKTIAIIVLALLVIASLTYIGYDYFSTKKNQRDQQIYVEGAQSGAQDTINYLFKQGADCKATPITIQNATVTMYPLECLFIEAVNCNPIPLTFNNMSINLLPTECMQIENK